MTNYRAMRTSRGISQRRLALLANTSKACIEKLETGKPVAAADRQRVEKVLNDQTVIVQQVTRTGGLFTGSRMIRSLRLHRARELAGKTGMPVKEILRHWESGDQWRSGKWTKKKPRTKDAP